MGIEEGSGRSGDGRGMETPNICIRDKDIGSSDAHFKQSVHLGFAEPIEDSEQLNRVAFRSPDFDVWDGGQLGGCPSWLHPQHIPQGPLLCRNDHHMQLLCQIYAPVDEMETRAFHRALYVFACSQCAGENDQSENDGKSNKPSVRVLRAQLPQENPYFPSDPDSLSEEDISGWVNHLPKANLCQVCGFKASYQCPLQKQYFCGKAHQKEYFRHVFHPQQQQEDDSCQYQMVEMPSLYPISEIVVEAEGEDAESNENDEKDKATKLQSTALFPQTCDGDDSDEDLEQGDLNNMIRGTSQKKTSSTDTTTLNFLEQSRRNPDQVLRYSRWQSTSPLWFREEGQPPQTSNDGETAIPPNCELCGAPRKFEFQLMPQMLNYLLKRRQEQHQTARAANTPEMEEHWKKVMKAMQQADSWIEQAPSEQIPPSLIEAKETATRQYQQAKLGNPNGQELDFGVIVVYTCTGSCGDPDFCSPDSLINPLDMSLGAYREEYAWVQTSS